MINNLGSKWSKPTKLPIWRTVGKAYRSFFENFGTVVRITWLWGIVLGVLTFYFADQQLNAMFAAFHEMLAQGKTGSYKLPLRLQLFQVLLTIASVTGICYMSVAWHRFLLLSGPAGASGVKFVDRVVWKYLVAILVIAALAAFAALPFFLFAFFHLFLMTPPSFHPPKLAFVLLPIALAATFIVPTRLSLLLPARAVGDNGLTVRETWRRTKGNTGRIILGFLLSSLPPLIPLQIVLIASGLTPLPNAGPPHAEAIDKLLTYSPYLSSISTAYSLLVLPILIGFLSFAYKHLLSETASPVVSDG